MANSNAMHEQTLFELTAEDFATYLAAVKFANENSGLKRPDLFVLPLGTGFARNRISSATESLLPHQWLRRCDWCEPTERLAYIGPPLRRRTSAHQTLRVLVS